MARNPDQDTSLPAPIRKCADTPDILDFTPVPRKRKRRGGWSADRQRAFIAALAELGTVRAACRRVGCSEYNIYSLRKHPEGASFARAWEAALDIGIQRIEDVAMERALHGVEVPVYHAGELVGTRRAYNDRLLMFILKNRMPDRFGASGSGGADCFRKAMGKTEKRRLKKKWRKEWEAERAAKSGVTAAELRASIDAKVAKIKQQVKAERALEWAKLSEETRAAWDRFEELRNRDLDALKADAETRGMLQEGPRECEEFSKPPEKKVWPKKVRKTVHKLTDDG